LGRFSQTSERDGEIRRFAKKIPSCQIEEFLGMINYFDNLSKNAVQEKSSQNAVAEQAFITRA